MFGDNYTIIDLEDGLVYVEFGKLGQNATDEARRMPNRPSPVQTRVISVEPDDLNLEIGVPFKVNRFNRGFGYRALLTAELLTSLAQTERVQFRDMDAVRTYWTKGFSEAYASFSRCRRQDAP